MILVYTIMVAWCPLLQQYVNTVRHDATGWCWTRVSLPLCPGIVLQLMHCFAAQLLHYFGALARSMSLWRSLLKSLATSGSSVRIWIGKWTICTAKQYAHSQYAKQCAVHNMQLGQYAMATRMQSTLISGSWGGQRRGFGRNTLSVECYIGRGLVYRRGCH